MGGEQPFGFALRDGAWTSAHREPGSLHDVPAPETGSISLEEASRHIDQWFRRGYVLFSDLTTRSTCLRRTDGSHA